MLDGRLNFNIFYAVCFRINCDYSLSENIPMPDQVTYNQLITLNGNAINCQTLRGSYAAEGKLILVYGNSRKLILDGKTVYSTGYQKRIRELVSLEAEAGYTIPEKSVLHYARGNDAEYVLVRW